MITVDEIRKHIIKLLPRYPEERWIITEQDAPYRNDDIKRIYGVVNPNGLILSKLRLSIDNNYKCNSEPRIWIHFKSLNNNKKPIKIGFLYKDVSINSILNIKLDTILRQLQYANELKFNIVCKINKKQI